ncbi:MAG: hypothetical protein AB8I80_23125 [Anaerolineae bacterium]
MEQAIIAMDMGGTQLRFALFDEEYRIVERHAEPTRPEQGPQRVLDRIVARLRPLGAQAGWDRQRIIDTINAHTVRPATELVRGADGIAEGLPEGAAEMGDVPKFRPGGLMLAYCGGGAGLFSQIIGGWVTGDTGSQPIARAVRY